MNKRTSTLSEFIQTLILFVGVLWLYISYEGPEIWQLDFANYIGTQIQQPFRSMYIIASCRPSKHFSSVGPSRLRVGCNCW